MDPKQIPDFATQRAPIRHQQFSLSLSARINYLREALDEVYPHRGNGSTNSSGTLTPESEVVWWERLTRCYLAYTEPKDLSFKQKQAAFKVLFNLGMGNDLRDLSAELACLPVGAREEVLGLMGKAVQ